MQNTEDRDNLYVYYKLNFFPKNKNTTQNKSGMAEYLFKNVEH